MSKTSPVATAGIAIDARSLDTLKLQAQRDQAGTVRQAARQFEAQFAQMLLSQMRQTSLAGQGGLAQALNSPATQTWRGMLDQQMAQTMAGVGAGVNAGAALARPSGLGLADVIEKQLMRSTVPAESVMQAGLPLSMSTLDLARHRASAALSNAQATDLSLLGAGRRIQNGSFDRAAAGDSRVSSGRIGGLEVALADGRPAGLSRSMNKAVAARTGKAAASGDSSEQTRAEFLGKFLPAARRAEAATGIPAAYILGQAALESGWGKREIRSADGQPSFNLFGIKATGWKGRFAQTQTTEYHEGKAERVSAKFRAYGSYEEAFEDYARMLVSNPRYAAAVKSTASAEQFAQGLQRAGYATDPQYAQKLTSTIRAALKRVI